MLDWKYMYMNIYMGMIMDMGMNVGEVGCDEVR